MSDDEGKEVRANLDFDSMDLNQDGVISREEWLAAGAQQEPDRQGPSGFRFWPPLYLWSTKSVTRVGRREVRRDPSKRLRGIAQHLMPRLRSQEPLPLAKPAPLTELVGDLRLGRCRMLIRSVHDAHTSLSPLLHRFDRKPYKQNAWRVESINGASVWCSLFQATAT